MKEGFVLKVDFFRDNSYIVKIFSRQMGLVAGVVKVPSKAQMQPIKSALQIGNKIEFDLSPGVNLNKIFSMDILEASSLFNTEILLCVSYLNEILLRLVKEGVVLENLYEHYQASLSLMEYEPKRELALRSFELALFDELGVNVDPSWDYEKERAVSAELFYTIRPGVGLVQTDVNANYAFAGDDLLRLVDGDVEDLQNLKLRKKIHRLILDDLLEGKPLLSRSAYKSYLS